MKKTIYPKLKGKIIEVYGTQSEFAKALGINKATLSKKLSGEGDFTLKEAVRIMDLLKIEDGGQYFFEKTVN